MLKPQKNIILLVAFHIMVLLLPLLAKGLHHHENNLSPVVFHHEKAISKVLSRCLICEFEYVSFIQPNLINTSVRCTPIVVKNPILVCPEIQVVYSLSLLRAPPVC